MSQRFLKFETETNNPLVDENGMIKQPVSSEKKRILLFENLDVTQWVTEGSGVSYVEFDLTNYASAYPQLCQELKEGTLFNKYKFVIMTKTNTDNIPQYSKVTIEYDLPITANNNAYSVNAVNYMDGYNTQAFDNVGVLFNYNTSKCYLTFGKKSDPESFTVIACYIEEI